MSPIVTAAAGVLAYKGTADAYCDGVIKSVSILLLAAGMLGGADDRQVALSLRAQADFDRVWLSAPQRLEDTERCVQSQAALLPVAAPADLERARFHRGYCLLAGALVAHDQRAFEAAARELEPLLPQLAAIARWHAGSREAPPAAAAPHTRCASAVVPQSLCRDAATIAEHWRGWFAAQEGRLDEAAAAFSPGPEGWSSWVKGRQEFTHGRYAEAVPAFRRAVEAWTAAEAVPPASIPRGLEPPGDTARALADLGAAQLAAGDAKAAIPSLDAAIRRRPTGARALWLRARAREVTGAAEGALADFSMASRAAFAEAGENPSGDAHLYRGIWFFRRKQYPAAEDEFTRALNQPVEAEVRPDASAWRLFAAVAQGSCGASRENLQKSLASVSPFFPRDDALAALSACRP